MLDQVTEHVQKLMKHFKEPTWSLKEDMSPNKSGLQIPNIEDTFAFSSQILQLQGKLDETIYKVEKSVNQFKTQVSEKVEVFDTKMVEFDSKLKIRQTDSPLEVNEEWHAELTEDALHSVEKLQTFVQDEVYLQFAHHFRKLVKLREVKTGVEKNISLQNRKVSHMSMRLLELESKQLMELTKVRNQSKTLLPAEAALLSPKSRILQQRNNTVMLADP